MPKQTVFMYSGQGSQYYQMGKELYDQNERFRTWMNYCDEAAYYYLGESLIDRIYKEQASMRDSFDRLLYSNPAILAIEFSLTKVLMEKGIIPDMLIGYSLGEITSQVVSGSVSLEDGFLIAIESAKVLEADACDGAMMSVLAPESELQQHKDLFTNVMVAGDNFSDNRVYSGAREDILRLQKSLKEHGVVTQLLPVKYAFHSPLMEQHRSALMSVASKVNYRTPSIPILSCVDSKLCDTPEPQYIFDIFSKKVLFSHTISQHIRQGDSTYIDVGPSGTLATFAKYSGASEYGCKAFEVMNPFGKNCLTLDTLLEVVYMQD